MMRELLAAAVCSAVALVGFAGAANAGATVDLIWIDVTGTNAMGNVLCLRDTVMGIPTPRNCPFDPRAPSDGHTIQFVPSSAHITLGVIVTAGAGGVVGAGVSVDYDDASPLLSVTHFSALTTSWSLVQFVEPPSHTLPFIDHINALSLTFFTGLGLPAGQSAYLGTVSFHMDQRMSGTFEIAVGTFGPSGKDGIGDLGNQVITSTTTFNSAFVTIPEPGALAALGSGIAMLALLYRRRRYSDVQ